LSAVQHSCHSVCTCEISPQPSVTHVFWALHSSCLTSGRSSPQFWQCLASCRGTVLILIFDKLPQPLIELSPKTGNLRYFPSPQKETSGSNTAARRDRHSLAPNLTSVNCFNGPVRSKFKLVALHSRAILDSFLPQRFKNHRQYGDGVCLPLILFVLP